MSFTEVPSPPLYLSSSALVCSEALFEFGARDSDSAVYPITIGAGTIIHPRAVLKSTKGPIVIGNNCVIEELVTIEATQEKGVRIGDWNVLRVGSTIHGGLGHGNVVECRAKIAAGGSVSNGCVVGTFVTVSHSLHDGVILVLQTPQYGSGVSPPTAGILPGPAKLAHAVSEAVFTAAPPVSAMMQAADGSINMHSTEAADPMGHLQQASFLVQRVKGKIKTNTTAAAAASSTQSSSSYEDNEQYLQNLDDIKPKLELLRELLSNTHRLVKTVPNSDSQVKVAK